MRDFPAQGRGALEGKAGADVYISAVIPDDRTDVSKGMLAQAKWDHSAKNHKLPEQIGKMMERTELSSCLWVYGRNGATCYPTGDYLNPDTEGGGGQSVGSLIANGPQCEEGDRGIGRDLTKPLITSLNEIMEEPGVQTGVSFMIREGNRRHRFYRKRRGKSASRLR